MGSAAGSVAQEAEAVPAFSGSGWQVQCGNDGTGLDCSVVQQIARTDTGGPVAALTLRLPAETGVPVLMVQLPLGIQVTAPVTLQVDGGGAENISLQTCTVAGCFAGTQISETLLARLKDGAQLIMGFQRADGQAVTMTIPLAGFTLAYQKL
jgi:invasion protein IalB